MYLSTDPCFIIGKPLTDSPDEILKLNIYFQFLFTLLQLLLSMRGPCLLI